MNREYKGLEPKVAENLSTEISIGQYGIASSYEPTGTWSNENSSK